MIRRCIVCAIALLILVARLPSASADNATSTTDAERITLTVSPVFGDPQLLSDTVYTLDIASDTIMYQEIRQSDGAILDKDAFLAKSADVIALLQAIDEHLFFSLPDLIEAADVSDGAYCYLTVETRQTVKTCGGLNSYRSKNQGFVTIYEAFDRIWQNAQRIVAQSQEYAPYAIVFAVFTVFFEDLSDKCQKSLVLVSLALRFEPFDIPLTRDPPTPRTSGADRISHGLCG